MPDAPLDPTEPTIRYSDLASGLPRDPADATTQLQPPGLEGQRVAKYLIRSRLGGGGMGVVYLAEMDFGGVGTKFVALKTIRPKYLADDDAVRRFQEEAYSASTLKTSFVVQVYDFDKVPGPEGSPPTHYIVMEYCNAGTLASHVAALPDRRLPTDEAVRLLLQACDALHAAERRKDDQGRRDPLVHRDIKPANLMLQRSDANDRVDMRIGDFGTVKRHLRDEAGPDDDLSQHGAPMTPAYASPEQLLGDELDHRSDMYSLGASFYHALTGQRATPDTKDRQVLRQFVLQTPFLSPRTVLESVPEPLDAIVRRMTARHAKDRYASFADVIADLEKLRGKKAPVWRIVAAAGLFAVAAAFAAYKLAGTASYSAESVLADYDKLAERLGLAIAAPNPIEELGLADEAKELGERLAKKREQVQRLASRGGEALVDKDDVDEQAQVKTDVSSLERRLGAARESWSRLAELEHDIDVAPHATVVQSIREVRTVDVQAVAKRKDELLEKAERVQAARWAELNRVQDDLARSGGDPSSSLTQLQERAARLNIPKGDEALGHKAEQLTAAIQKAKELEDALPTWSADPAAEPIATLNSFLIVLDKLNATEAGDAQAWWRMRCQRLGQEWSASLLATIREAVSAANNARTELLGLDRSEATQRLNALKGDFQALREVLQRLTNATSSLVLEAQRTEIQKAVGGFLTEAEPSLRYSVVSLRAAYETCRQRAAKAVDTARFSSSSIGDVIAAADRALEFLAGSPSDTIADLSVHDTPEILERRLDDALDTEIKDLQRQFSGGAQPGDIAGTLKSLQELLRVPNVRAKAQSLAEAVARAGELAQAVPSPIEQAAFEKAVVDFSRAVEAICMIRDEAETDPDLQGWRRQWSQQRLKTLTENMSKMLAHVSEELGDVVRKLLVPAQRIDAIVPGFLTSVQKSIDLIENGGAPRKPDLWSQAAWDLWPHECKVPQDLAARPEGGRLVCWFPFRQRVDGDSKVNVEMLLVRGPDGASFLVDRHEVCVGELLALGVSERKRDPGDYLRWRSAHWAKLKGEPHALLSWTRQTMAIAFAQTAYPEQKFDLPGPDLWRTLVAAAPQLSPRAPRDQATEVTIESLDEHDGLRGLRSGLAEWLADGRFAPPSDYLANELPSGTTVATDWLKGTGFRCVLALQ